MMLLLTAAPSAWCQGVEFQGRPIREVKIEGLDRTSRQLVANQLRTQAGTAYQQSLVSQDVQNITRLGRFTSVQVKVQQDEAGQLTVIYLVQEQSMLADVQVVGNKALADKKLLERVMLRPGDLKDQYLIDRGTYEIARLYRETGYPYVKVTIDQAAMKQQQVLIYRVVEGPRIRVWSIRFNGNTEYEDNKLRAQIKTKVFIPVLEKGILLEDRLAEDAMTLRQFYYDRGYLDARVGRRVVLDQKQGKAEVIFDIQEGPRFTVEKISIQGNTLYSEADLRLAMPLKLGDVLTSHLHRDSVEAIAAKYNKLGYIDTQVQLRTIFPARGNTVTILVQIDEGRRYVVGRVMIRGNTLTQDRVVRRLLRGLDPGRPYDMTGITKSEQMLRESPLFSTAKITVMGNDLTTVRDALVEVKEQRTGSLSFGAAVSDSAGLMGSFSLSQRNFDITDLPDSWDEVFAGKAFSGAGQTFDLKLQPGFTVQNYMISFGEPYFMETDIGFNANAQYYARDFSDYFETRAGGGVGFSKRFGDVYGVSIGLRGASIGIDDINNSAPQDIWDVHGSNALDVVTLSFSRDTTDSMIFPTRGSVLVGSYQQAGLLGGDFHYKGLDASFRQYWTVDEDFFGYKSVFIMRTNVGYMFGDVPVFNRYYAGSRSFRGFAYRGIGPLGYRHDNGQLSDVHVGGVWQCLLTLEYNFPIWKDTLRWVVFTDQGTISNVANLEQWRVTVGTGIRIKLPMMGEAPFAIDFGVPILKEDGDQVQIISFSLDLPF